MKETIGLFVLLLVGCVKPQQGPYDLPPPGWDGPPVMQCDLVRTKTIASHVDEGDLVVPHVGSATIKWTAPARWQSVPNPSAMRLATFKIPHAAGDTEDAELSVTQVGGSVDSNIERWIGQFDAAGQKTAKKATKTVKGWKVTFVEIEGSFSGGMGGGGPQNGWGLEGAIVETPGMPHFFKMTGPAKTVKAARAELEGLVDTIAPI